MKSIDPMVTDGLQPIYVFNMAKTVAITLFTNAFVSLALQQKQNIRFTIENVRKRINTQI